MASEVVPMPGTVIESGVIELSVNGAVKQQSNVDKLIWNIREIIADLSLFYHLQPGDLIYTGTPEGVGPVKPGDTVTLKSLPQLGELKIQVRAHEIKA